MYKSFRFVCLYAVCGAWVFYSIESPHEDRVIFLFLKTIKNFNFYFLNFFQLKVHGIKRVQDLRRQLVKDLMEMDTESGRPVWMTGAGGHMRRFGEDIFRSYKEQYVRSVLEDEKLTRQSIYHSIPRFMWSRIIPNLLLIYLQLAIKRAKRQWTN